MGATATIELDFGAGSDEATYTVTSADLAIAGLVAGSNLEAWIEPAATADHSADEHMLEQIRVFADKASIVAGVSFVVTAIKSVETVEIPLGWTHLVNGRAGRAGRVNELRGKYKVGVAWN